MLTSQRILFIHNLCIAFQRTFLVQKVVGSTWPAGDAIGSLRGHPHGLRPRIHAERLGEEIWHLLTAWSCKTSSTTPFQCECYEQRVSFHVFIYASINIPFPLCFRVRFRKTTVWVWLKRSGGEGTDQVVESVSPAWWAGGSESQGGCTQMALGTQGRWRKAQCAGRYLFLCEKEVTGKTFIPLENTRDTHSQKALTLADPSSCRVFTVCGQLPDWIGSHDRHLYSDPDPPLPQRPRDWTTRSGGR